MNPDFRADGKSVWISKGVDILEDGTSKPVIDLVSISPKPERVMSASGNVLRADFSEAVESVEIRYSNNLNEFCQEIPLK